MDSDEEVTWSPNWAELVVICWELQMVSPDFHSQNQV